MRRRREVLRTEKIQRRAKYHLDDALAAALPTLPRDMAAHLASGLVDSAMARLIDPDGVYRGTVARLLNEAMKLFGQLQRALGTPVLAAFTDEEAA